MTRPHLDAGPRLRVVVVEDDGDVLDTLRDALAEELGVAAEGVRRADDALRLLESAHYDVLMADERLPGMSGSDLIRTVQKRLRPPSCILISAYHETTAGVKLAASIGAAQFLRKPVKLQELHDALALAGGVSA